jgi:hypothetical protein
MMIFSICFFGEGSICSFLRTNIWGENTGSGHKLFDSAMVALAHHSLPRGVFS